LIDDDKRSCWTGGVVLTAIHIVQWKQHQVSGSQFLAPSIGDTRLGLTHGTESFFYLGGHLVV
jgi:hypothetical protein